MLWLRDGSLAEVTAGTGPFQVLQVKVQPYDANIGLDLPWAEVGLFLYDGLDYNGGAFQVQRDEIKGKAMLCGEVLSTWLQPWFMSKVDQ